PDRTELTTLQGRNHALETPARPAATLARLASAGVVRPIAGTGPGFVDCATGHPWRTPVRHPRAGLPGRLPGGAARAVARGAQQPRRLLRDGATQRKAGGPEHPL